MKSIYHKVVSVEAGCGDTKPVHECGLWKFKTLEEFTLEENDNVCKELEGLQ